MIVIEPKIIYKTYDSVPDSRIMTETMIAKIPMRSSI